MSDTATKVKPANIEKEGYKLEYNEFGNDSDLRGFGYYDIQFKSAAAATAHLGDDAVLLLINRAASSGLQVKARNKLNKEEGEDKEKWQDRIAAVLVTEGPILVTPQDAEGWKPGERDVTSISGVTKKMQEALKEAKEAKAKAAAAPENSEERNTNNERFAKCVALAKEYKAQLDKMQEEELLKLAA